MNIIFPEFKMNIPEIDMPPINHINQKFNKQREVIINDINAIIAAEEKRQRKVKIIKAAISGAVIGLIVALVVKRS